MGFEYLRNSKEGSGYWKNVNAEWLRSGYQQITLRWVFDHRYLNSVTITTKIHLPLIERLVDKMIAFRMYTETEQWRKTPMGAAIMP
ncbi:Retroelement pol Polyprotein [Phytophthora palmivora]|uniref:Retroelement pol Polyprotein n=1 Tax=Phytophthora palmivora TaxID=4796 RepID=A0A2P4Y7N4_9STRA|nr:Retroelement pol Polyprotein [Phytophthora palmivora]